MVELGNPKIRNPAKTRKKPDHKTGQPKYIKYSNFEKIYVYSCASIWIQAIIHKFAKFLIYITSKSPKITLKASPALIVCFFTKKFKKNYTIWLLYRTGRFRTKPTGFGKKDWFRTEPTGSIPKPAGFVRNRSFPVWGSGLDRLGVKTGRTGRFYRFRSDSGNIGWDLPFHPT